jgi:potassium channel LctB
MLISVLISFTLFGLTGLIHYSVMMFALARLSKSGLQPIARMIIGFYAVGAAHLTEAGLYAFGFAYGRYLGIGNFLSSDGPVEVMQLFYFSLVNYTSLGLGDIYPTGHLRFMTGVESLNGFLLISCSAAFIFLLMRGESKGA